MKFHLGCRPRRVVLRRILRRHLISAGKGTTTEACGLPPAQRTRATCRHPRSPAAEQGTQPSLGAVPIPCRQRTLKPGWGSIALSKLNGLPLDCKRDFIKGDSTGGPQIKPLSLGIGENLKERMILWGGQATEQGEAPRPQPWGSPHEWLPQQMEQGVCTGCAPLPRKSSPQTPTNLRPHCPRGLRREASPDRAT